MTETSTVNMKNQNQFYFSWIHGIFLKPRQTLRSVVARPSTWLTPMLVLTLAVLMNTIVVGWLNQKAAESGIIPTPPDFQYWPPEMQTQYMQSQQVRQGPVFQYIIPAIGSITATWIGWLLVGGMLHLATTILGGRGETNVSMTLVAWASLPLALRAAVRATYSLITQRLILSEGISGLVTLSGDNLSNFLFSLLTLIDIYLIWHTILMIIGMREYTNLQTGKVIVGVLSVILIVILSQTLFGYLTIQLSSLSIIRPFFF
jgi:hypothetical protein